MRGFISYQSHQRTHSSAFLIALLLICLGSGCQSVRFPKSLSFSSLMNRNKQKTDDSQIAERKPEKPVEKIDQVRLAQTEYRMGEQAFTAGDYEKARQHYEAAIAHHADHKLAHHRLAYAYDQLKNPQLAEMHFLTAKQLAPNDVDLLNDLGYFYMSQQRYADSERLLREALNLNSKHQQAQLNMATLYARQGQADRALAMFRSVLPESDAQASLKQALAQSSPSTAMPAQEIQMASANTQDFADAPNDLTRQLKLQMQQGREQSLKRRQEQQQMQNPLAQHPFANSQDRTDAMVKDAIHQIESPAEAVTQSLPQWGNPQIPTTEAQTTTVLTNAAQQTAQAHPQTKPMGEHWADSTPVSAHTPSAASMPSEMTPTNTALVSQASQTQAAPMIQATSHQYGNTVSQGHPASSHQPTEALKAFEQASEQAMLIGLQAGPGQLFPSLPNQSSNMPASNNMTLQSNQPTHAMSTGNPMTTTPVSHPGPYGSTTPSQEQTPQLPTIINGFPGQQNKAAEQPSSSATQGWLQNANPNPMNSPMPVIAPRNDQQPEPASTQPQYQQVPDWPYSSNQNTTNSTESFIQANRQQIETARQHLNSGQNWSLTPSSQLTNPAAQESTAPQTPLNQPTGNTSSAFEQQLGSQNSPFYNAVPQANGNDLPVIQSR